MQELTWIAVVSAGVATVISTSAQLGIDWFKSRTERGKHAWQREYERIMAVEERAGIVVDRVRSHREGEVPDAELRGMLTQLGTDVGRLMIRYRELSGAVRDVHHWSGCVLADKFKHSDWREAGKELDAAVGKLLEQAKKVTDR
jgi:hypothetical protein